MGPSSITVVCSRAHEWRGTFSALRSTPCSAHRPPAPACWLLHTCQSGHQTIIQSDDHSSGQSFNQTIEQSTDRARLLVASHLEL
eukprot:6214106-Prymnesium_polylepis.1